jgi:hypothetical protein
MNPYWRQQQFDQPQLPGPPMGMPVDWRQRGTDSVPAMLTPGEGVLNQGAAAMVGKDNIDALNQAGQGMPPPPGTGMWGGGGGYGYGIRPQMYQGGGVVYPDHVTPPVRDYLPFAQPTTDIPYRFEDQPNDQSPLGNILEILRRNEVKQRPSIEINAGEPNPVAPWAEPTPIPGAARYQHPFPNENIWAEPWSQYEGEPIRMQQGGMVQPLYAQAGLSPNLPPGDINRAVDRGLFGDDGGGPRGGGINRSGNFGGGRTWWGGTDPYGGNPVMRPSEYIFVSGYGWVPRAQLAGERDFGGGPGFGGTTMNLRGYGPMGMSATEASFYGRPWLDKMYPSRNSPGNASL